MKFTTFGVIVMSVIFWSAAQSANAEIKKLMNLFLFVLLTSMILLNWTKVEPIFFKKG